MLKDKLVSVGNVNSLMLDKSMLMQAFVIYFCWYEIENSSSIEVWPLYVLV